MLKLQKAHSFASKRERVSWTTARPALLTRHPSVRGRFGHGRSLCAILSIALLSCSASSFAHPMGNFSISHYAGIRLDRGYIEIRYILDEAEIPTFQEIQRTGMVPWQLNSDLSEFLADQPDAMKAGLRLELDGQPVTLATISSDVIFPAGAGGLPTMKLGF